MSGRSLLAVEVACRTPRKRSDRYGELCKLTQQLGLLELAYESNSHRPQLLVSLSERGVQVRKSITEDDLMNHDQYLGSLASDIPNEPGRSSSVMA